MQAGIRVESPASGEDGWLSIRPAFVRSCRKVHRSRRGRRSRLWFGTCTLLPTLRLRSGVPAGVLEGVRGLEAEAFASAPVRRREVRR